MQTPKPRLTYAAFVAAQNPKTLSYMIEAYIKSKSRAGAGGMSYRQAIGYRALQRQIGETKPEEWQVATLTEYAYARRANEFPMNYPAAGQKKALSPSTVGADFTRLKVLLKWANYELDMPLEKARAVLDKAMYLLKKDEIIDKAQALDERYTPEEEKLFLEYFAAQNGTRNTVIDMHEFFAWQMASARRRAESCALLWCDWDREKHTMVVRHVKARKGAQVATLPPRAQALLQAKWDKLPEETKQMVASLGDDDEQQPRIFPYKPESVSSRMMEAGKAIGIRRRLHSARRECATRLVEEDGYTVAEARQVTLHATDAIIQRHYIKPDPSVLALRGPASRRQQ